MYSSNLSSFVVDAQGDRLAGRPFFRMALALCVLSGLSFLFLPLPTFQWFSDYWEHASALRVLSESPLAPTNPHYASLDPDRQFIPLFVVLGWVMSVTGMSVTTALGIAGVITTVLFCAGVSAFARAYYAHRLAPVVMAGVLLFCWGTPWVWAGFYSFRALFYNNFYPAAFVFSLTFIAWAVIIRALKRNALGIGEAFALLLLTWLMFVSHQLGGLFAVGGGVLFLMFEEREADNKVRLQLFMTLVAGVALTWWWPYFNPVELTVYGSGDKDNEGVPGFYDAVQVVLLIGPAWFAVPVLFAMFRRRVHLALVVGFTGVFAAYLAGGIFGHPVGHRFLSYAIVYLHLALIWQLLALLPDGPQLDRRVPSRFAVPVVLVLGTLVLLAQLAFGAADFGRMVYENLTGKSFGSFPNQPVMKELSAVAAAIPDDAVLFATADPALSITALKGKVVARPRPQLMITDGPARVQDNKLFFSRQASSAQRRQLIEKYGASHILFKKDDVSDHVSEELHGFGERVPTGGRLILIRIDRQDA